LAKQPAEFGLADGNVAGRKIGKHGGPGKRGLGARRQRNPDILADFRMHDKARQIFGFKQQIGAEGGKKAADADLLAHNSIARGEMTALVELAVVRQMDFRHHA
jgi:hypothetical protein